jgi:hypothetical protein
VTTREFRGDFGVLESTRPVVNWRSPSKAYTSALDRSTPAQLSISLDLQRSDRVRAGRGVRIDSLTFVIACPITRKVTLLRHHFPGPSDVGLGYTPALQLFLSTRPIRIEFRAKPMTNVERYRVLHFLPRIVVVINFRLKRFLLLGQVLPLGANVSPIGWPRYDCSGLVFPRPNVPKVRVIRLRLLTSG